MTFPEEKAEVDETTEEREVNRPRAEWESIRLEAHSIKIWNILLLNPHNRRRGLGNTASGQARSKLFTGLEWSHRGT